MRKSAPFYRFYNPNFYITYKFSIGMLAQKVHLDVQLQLVIL